MFPWAARAPTALEARLKALSKIHSIISISPTPTPTGGSPGLPEGPAPTASLMFTIAENSGHTWHGPPAHPETQQGHGNTTLNRCLPHPPTPGSHEPLPQPGRHQAAADCWSQVLHTRWQPWLLSGTGRSSEMGNGDPTVQHTAKHEKSCK